MTDMTDPNDPLISDLVINSLLVEWRAGNTTMATTYGQATRCLNATGRPLRETLVRQLPVKTSTVSNRAVAAFGEFVAAADAYIKRSLAGPNLKAQAAATARSAKGKPRPANDHGPALDHETA